MKIEFIPKDTFVAENIDGPKPASFYVPQWYRESEKYVRGNSLRVENYATNIGLKGCMPFIDMMTHGYMLELWTDIYVSEDPDKSVNPVLNWTNTPDPVKVRLPELGGKIPRPHEHYDRMFNWQLQWGIKAPKNYSLIYSHPFNRFDLPFTTLSGVIDSDHYWGEGAVPFFIKKGFTGVIPAGTPIIQIVPIRRNVWFSKVSEKLMKERDKQQWLLRTSITGFYKSKIRQKKIFR
jgi:hypothetical protein